MFYLFYRFYGHFVFRSPQPPPWGRTTDRPAIRVCCRFLVGGQPRSSPAEDYVLFDRKKYQKLSGGCLRLLRSRLTFETGAYSRGRTRPGPVSYHF